MLKPNHEKIRVQEGAIILENAKNRKFCKISSDSMIFRTQKSFDRIRHGRFNNTVQDRIILIINLLGQKWAIFTVPDPSHGPYNRRFLKFLPSVVRSRRCILYYSPHPLGLTLGIKQVKHIRGLGFLLQHTL